MEVKILKVTEQSFYRQKQPIFKVRALKLTNESGLEQSSQFCHQILLPASKFVTPECVSPGNTVLSVQRKMKFNWTENIITLEKCIGYTLFSELCIYSVQFYCSRLARAGLPPPATSTVAVLRNV